MKNNNLRPLHLRILFPELLSLPKTDPRRLGPPIDITSSKAVDLELYTYFAFLIRDFIHPWYRLITNDQDLTTEIMKVLVLIVQKLEKRLRNEVDWTELILIDIPKLLTIHYGDYREAKMRIHMNHGGGASSVADLFHGMQPHYALEPIKDREFEYLRLTTEAVLKVLLSNKDFESDCVRQLVREILSNLVLFNLIESLADPYTIHTIICKLLVSYEPVLDELEASGKFVETYFSALTNGKSQPGPFQKQPKLTKEEETGDKTLTKQMRRLQEKRRLQGQEITLAEEELKAENITGRHHFSFGYIILQVILSPIRSFWVYLAATFTQSQETYHRVNQHKKLTSRKRMIEPIMEFFYAACLVQERPLLQFAWQMLAMFFWPIVRVFGGGVLIDKFLEQTVLHLLSEDLVVFYLRLGSDLLWPNGEFMQKGEVITPLQREQMRVRAERLLTISIPQSVGYIIFETRDLNQLQSHIHDTLEPIQNKKINKHLLYFLVDLILTKVLPEL
ncbi:PXA domain-containing protein [Sporodiniella umbellata]|nr:PXA domain-containing protein [Sporodiniella umbellata]